MVSTSFDDKSPTPFALLQQHLLALLLFWPETPDISIPSLLLCGPPRVGKSYLIHSLRSVKDSWNVGRRNKGVEEDMDAPFITVMPSIAPALAVRTRDGKTGLHRLLKRVITNAVKESTKDTHHDKTHSSGVDITTARHTVLLVIDHVQFFMESDEDGAFSGISKEDNETSGGQSSSRHPVLFSDFYSLLRGSPGLFLREECGDLGLRRLVVIALFGGGFAERVHPFMRDRVFDAVCNLATPAEAERRAFFTSRLEPNPPNLLGDPEAAGGTKKEEKAAAGEGLAASASSAFRLALASALAFRTGGVNYTGLDAIAAEAAREFRARADDSSSFGACVRKEAVSAFAQRVVRGFVAGASTAARDYRRSAGYVDVQSTRWRDIAGMADVKETLQALVTRPLRYRALYRRMGVAPSTGVLLHGPPGTGKTMLAKAMATELNAAFLYLNLPELVQSAVGESERRLNEFVALARERSPAIMFVDELQAAFGVRYAGGQSSDPSQGHSAHDARLVAHLFYLLDEIHADEDHVVVFVGATNVVEMLDPLLLRPGRLDTHIAVPLPDADARESLARLVVNGEWASWMTSRTPPSDVQESAFALNEILIAEFVRRSVGWSGAELRNAMNVFALKVLQEVQKADRFLGKNEDLSPGGDVVHNALLRTHPSTSCDGVEFSDMALQALDDAFKR